MTPFLAPDTLPAEAAIVVLEPLDGHLWLREHGWMADRPWASPGSSPGYRIVAFSTVRHGRHHRGPYARRVWFVKSTDAAAYGDRDWPIEAVDPMSIAPRRASRPMGVPPWRTALARAQQEEERT
jgi:hypothetical protein